MQPISDAYHAFQQFMHHNKARAVIAKSVELSSKTEIHRFCIINFKIIEIQSGYFLFIQNKSSKQNIMSKSSNHQSKFNRLTGANAIRSNFALRNREKKERRGKWLRIVYGPVGIFLDMLEGMHCGWKSFWHFCHVAGRCHESDTVDWGGALS